MERNELEERIKNGDVMNTSWNLLNELSRAKKRKGVILKDIVHEKSSIGNCLSLQVGILERDYSKISFFEIKEKDKETYDDVVSEILRAITYYEVTI